MQSWRAFSGVGAATFPLNFTRRGIQITGRCLSSLRTTLGKESSTRPTMSGWTWAHGRGARETDGRPTVPRSL
eukprot:1016988-Pyramimonas_sp.AAC.1